MDTLCHAALVCCILSALAGLVRTFWPQNGFKPVINAVLTLYIITSVLHAVSGLNWQNFDAQLQNFASQSAPGEDYTAYVFSCEARCRSKGLRTRVQGADGALGNAGQHLFTA